MPPCVLVLGGSGFLGQYVVDALTKDGDFNVMVLSKSATRLGNHCSPAAPPPLAATNSDAPVVDRRVESDDTTQDTLSPSPGPSSASHDSSTRSQRRRGHVRYVYGNLATGEGIYDALIAAAKFGGDRDIDVDDSDFEERIEESKRTFDRRGLEDLCPDCNAFHDDVDEEDEQKRVNLPDFDEDEPEQTAEEKEVHFLRSAAMVNLLTRVTGGGGRGGRGGSGDEDNRPWRIGDDPAFDKMCSRLRDRQAMRRFKGMSKSDSAWGKCQHRRNRRYPGLAAVVNCAAVSSPAACEREPALSRAVNIPTKLVSAMREFGNGSLLVHLSTDQVYSGERNERDAEEFDVTPYADEEGEVTDEETGAKVARKVEKSRVARSLWHEREVARVGRAPLGTRERYEPFAPFYSAEKKEEEEEEDKKKKKKRDDDEEEDSDDDSDDRFGPDPRSEGGAGFLRTALRHTPEASADIDPINAYAKQKADAELMLSEKYPRSVCLRSSVMYGRLPRDRAAVKGTRFLQFVDDALRRSCASARRRGRRRATTRRQSSSSSSGQKEGEEEEEEQGEEEEEQEQASFFDDEFRSFVAVDDVAAAVVACVKKWGRPRSEDCGPPEKCFDEDDTVLPAVINVGGPQRLSRADFARLVAESRGYDASLVRAVPSASVRREAPSPRDISMSIHKLQELLGVEPKSVAEALKEMPPDSE